MNTLTSSHPENNKPEAATRKKRPVLAVLVAGSALLAACGGSTSSASPERIPAVTEASPSEVPNPETTENMPPMDTAEPTTTVESPETTFVDPEEPGGETGAETILSAERTFDNYGFPNNIIEVPAGLAPGDAFMALYNNVAACLNYCKENPQLLEDLGANDAGGNLKDAILNDYAEYYQNAVAISSNSGVLIRYEWENPDIAQRVIKTEELGITKDGNQVYTLSVDEARGDKFMGVAMDKEDVDLEGVVPHYLSWIGSISYYEDPETNTLKLFGFIHNES